MTVDQLSAPFYRQFPQNLFTFPFSNYLPLILSLIFSNQVFISLWHLSISLWMTTTLAVKELFLSSSSMIWLYEHHLFKFTNDCKFHHLYNLISFGLQAALTKSFLLSNETLSCLNWMISVNSQNLSFSFINEDNCIAGLL